MVLMWLHLTFCISFAVSTPGMHTPNASGHRRAQAQQRHARRHGRAVEEWHALMRKTVMMMMGRERLKMKKTSSSLLMCVALDSYNTHTHTHTHKHTRTHTHTFAPSLTHTTDMHMCLHTSVHSHCCVHVCNDLQVLSWKVEPGEEPEEFPLMLAKTRAMLTPKVVSKKNGGSGSASLSVCKAFNVPEER